jgi:glycosyltransferase involved in cell wall biosynthesis
MLRILHAIHTVDPVYGGPLEGVRQISKVNWLYGHRPEILSLDDPGSRWVRESEFTVHAMGPAYTAYGYCPRLVSWLRENHQRFDVVVINGIWAYNCFGVWRALRGTGTPYFVYTHGMLDPWFKFRYPFKHLKKSLFWPWAVFPVLRDAQAVLFTCDQERVLARESFWLYDCNEIVVSYGTPGVPDTTRDYAEIFLQARPELRPFRRFVFLGRVTPKKGPDIVLRALARLQQEGSWDARTMRLVMAGPADGHYAAKLQKLARSLGVEESVVWTGMLLGEQKWGALQSAETFLLPSHQENFGIAVAEALSVGVPVLISKSVNIWDEIVADGAGFACEDSVESFTELWRYWLGLDQEEKRLAGRRAKACFKHRYTAKLAAISLLSTVYQNLRAQRLLPAQYV